MENSFYLAFTFSEKSWMEMKSTRKNKEKMKVLHLIDSLVFCE